MTNTIAQGEALMKSAGQRLSNGGSWTGWCARFVCRFVTGVDASGSGLGASADTARQALALSGPIVSTDYRKAPAGAIHWWTDGGGDGHVAVDLVGGGSQIAMASSAVSGWGEASGVIGWAAYHAARPDMHYAGWTLDYCGAKIKAAPKPPGTYTVKSGDTLSGIASALRFAGGWQRLAQLNGLHDPYLIKPGDKLRLG